MHHAQSQSSQGIREYRFHFLLLLLLLRSPLAEAASQSSSASHPETLVTAQQMSSDPNTGVVTATGKVEIARSGYILLADKVIYDQKKNVMHASGHVSILSPQGEVQFANDEEITGDMKQAFAENVSILFPDNARFSARVAERYEGRWTVLDKGLFTSCNVCKERPDQPPLWQMRADKIIHDNIEHEVYYHNATLDFQGVPVLYTPYFSAADPTVERKQGFLDPTPGYTPLLKSFVKVPYYFDIDDDKDAIIAPTFSGTDKVQFAGQYRERIENGNLALDGSFTHADLVSDSGINEGYQWRGHIFGKFQYDINDVWRAGTDVRLASDKSYLPRYRIAASDELTNRGYLEGFQGRDYAAINTYYYEDLRPGVYPVEPFVLPQANFSALGEPGQTWGGRWSLDGSLLATTRDNANKGLNQQGPDTRRLALDTGWQRRFISDTGFISDLSALARLDSYWADNVVNFNTNSVYNNVLFTRPFEQASLVTGYPLSRQGEGYQEMLEPLVAITTAPTVHTPSNQPIEDSLDLEFDETSLFSPNRFTGTDLIEGGSRTTYGLRHSISTNSNAHIDMFGGQSFSFSRDNLFPADSGLANQLSDYVGRIDFVPADWFSMNYGARINHSDYAPRRQDAFLSVGVSQFRPFARYISAFQTETTGFQGEVKELSGGFTSKFAKYWNLSASHTQAFQPQPGPRSSSIDVTYNDECFVFGVTGTRNNTTRTDISSGDSIVFRLYLRDLGGIHTDSGSKISFPAELREE